MATLSEEQKKGVEFFKKKFRERQGAFSTVPIEELSVKPAHGTCVEIIFKLQGRQPLKEIFRADLFENLDDRSQLIEIIDSILHEPTLSE